MALIRRVSRLITADVHAVLDQIEEPEVVLKQAIREMEEELAKQVQHGRWLAKEIESTGARLEGLEKTRRDLDEKLDLCFANDNEALARQLTRRKLEAAKLEARLDASRSALADELADHESQLASNRDQLEGMRQKAAIFSFESSTGNGARPGETPDGIDDADVEIAFLREKQARTRS
jgi:phage shock protein A